MYGKVMKPTFYLKFNNYRAHARELRINSEIELAALGALEDNPSLVLMKK